MWKFSFGVWKSYNISYNIWLTYIRSKLMSPFHHAWKWQKCLDGHFILQSSYIWTTYFFNIKTTEEKQTNILFIILHTTVILTLQVIFNESDTNCLIYFLPVLNWELMLKSSNIPVNMPLYASTGPVLGRCCQHRTSTGPVQATNGMFTGI